MSVYFAQREPDGLIKIGWSRSVAVRLANIRAKMLGSIPGGREEEKRLHAQFAHLRVNGEWFAPGNDLLEFIRSAAQDHKPESKSRQTAIRLHQSILDRVDKVAESLSLPGMRVTRSEALRIVVSRGMDQLEAEHGL